VVGGNVPGWDVKVLRERHRNLPGPRTARQHRSGAELSEPASAGYHEVDAQG